jgi:16S rRNA pseudouridine516 synthase
MDLIVSRRKDLVPVGRLDKDTEGALLITNDGVLGHHLISPKYHVKKKYYVEVDHDEIKNMRDSLAFYETLSENNQKVLTEILDKSKELADTNIQLIIEVQNLKAQVGILLNIINSELGDIDFNKYGIKVENGTVSRKKAQKK